LDFYLPDSSGLVGNDSFSASHWIKSVPDLAIKNPVLASAFDALATARLGQTNNDALLLTQSSKAYGKALVAVHKALSVSDQMCSTELLACILVLALYEVRRVHTLITLSTWLMHGLIDVWRFF
jgi:hypothetical protein